MNLKLCFIKKEYFEKNENYVKMLDIGNTQKQAKRSHLCLQIKTDSNNYYVPLRNNLGAEIRKYGRSYG